MSLAVLVIVLVLLAAGWYVLSLRLWPYAPCRWCRGKRRRSPVGGWWGDCRHCGGSGKRLRRGAKKRK